MGRSGQRKPGPAVGPEPRAARAFPLFAAWALVFSLLALPIALPPSEAHVKLVGQNTTGSTTDATSALLSHTVPVGDHRVLVAVIHHLDQTGPAIGARAQARYGTTDMTCPPEARSEGAFVDGRRLLVATQVCYLVAPAVGTANVLVLWDQPVASYILTAASYENAEPGPPGMPTVGAMGQSNAVSADPELVLATDQDGSLVVGGANAKSVEPVRFVPLTGTTTIPGSAISASTTPGALDDIRAVSGHMQATLAGPNTLGWDLQLDPSGAPSTPRDIAIAAIELHTHPDAGWDSSSDESGVESVASPRLTVELRHRFGATMKVGYAATGGTATQGSDYTFPAGPCTAAAPCELEIAAGSLTADIPIAVVDDRLSEDNETVEVTLSSLGGSHVLSPVTHTYTILDDDVDVRFRVATGNGTESVRHPTVLVDLSRPWPEPITVSYQVHDGRAVRPADYLLDAGSLEFPAFNTTQAIRLEVVDDIRDEVPENLTIVLTAALPANAEVSEPSLFEYVILDNDVEPVLNVSALSPIGEDAGPATATVTLTPDSGKTVTVGYVARDGAAKGRGTDYTLANGTLTFAPGQTSATITVPLTDDAIDEDDEDFFVDLANPVNATLDTATAPVVIDSEDQAGIVVSRAGLAVTEPEPGTPAVPDTYTVRLATQPTEPVRITIAALGDDATTDRVTIDFAPADWDVPRTIQALAVDDSIDEADPHNDTLRHTATGDPRYARLDPVDLPVVVDDNDVASVRLSRSSLEVGEDSLDDAFTAVLTSQPETDVTVTLDIFDGQATLDTGSGPTSTVTLTFTPLDWAAPQPVLVRAVDDHRNETDIHLSSIVSEAASADPLYDGWPVPDLPIQVHDDDEAGIRYSATLLALAEDGTPTASYTVVLRSQPAANVTVTLDVEGEQASADATTLTFTPTGWDTPQTVQVQAFDDAVDEASPHADRVLHVAASADRDYSIPTPRAVDLAIADNDEAALVVEPAELSMAEDAAAASYTVRLATEPKSPVTVTVAAEPGLDATAVLVFTPADWMVPQPVEVQPTDDDRVTGNRTVVVQPTAASDDGPYAGASALLPVTVLEDDAVGIVVLDTALEVTEGGASTSYGIRLASEPSGPVTITVVPDDDPATYLEALHAGSPTLTFMPGDWMVPQFVTVRAPEDDIANGAPDSHTDLLRHTVASSDAAYDELPVADVAVTIADDDQPGVLLGPASLTVGEDGTTDTLLVRLLSEPKEPVTIDLAALGRTLLADDALTIAPADWRTVFAIPVAVDDDAIDQAPLGPSDEADAIAATVTSADPAYQGHLPADLPVTVRDDDTAALLASRATIPLAEGGPADTFTLRLASQPAADVTVTVATPADATASPATLTFTPTDWADARPVTVGAVDDDVDEDAEDHNLTATAATADPLYGGRDATVLLQVADDDTASLRVAPTSVAVTEGGAGVRVRYTLGSEPAAPVTVTLTPGSRVGVLPTTLVLDAANWQAGLEAVVSGPDDDRIRPSPFAATVAATVTSADARYAALPQLDLPVTVTEDDTAALVVAETGGRTTATEGGAVRDSYTLALQTIPDADVEVTVLADAQSEVSTDDATWASSLLLVFGSMAPRTVFVRAVDDASAEGPHGSALTHTIVTADPHYAALPTRVLAVAVTDNDAPGLDIVELDGATQVAEAGTTSDAYTIALTTVPAADVTVTIAPAIAAQLDIWPASLTFTPGDWNVPQAVTVTALQDLVDDAETPLALRHVAASSDLGYDGLPGNDVNVTILDDDVAGIEMAATLAVAEGGTAMHRVRLTSQPIARVEVTLAATSEAGVPATALAFTSGDWSIWQEVPVAGRPDDVDDGDATATVTARASSSDPAHDGQQATTTVTVLDDDTAGIVATPGSVAVAEGGAGATVTVQLGSRPAAAVRVAVATGSQATATASLTFEPAAWDVPQAVAVAAAADAVDEGTHGDALRFTAASDDPHYDAFPVPDVPVTITDDDAAGLVLEPALGGTAVAEGGGNDTYRIRLASQPTAAVTITLAGDAQLAGLPATVTIAPASWNIGALVSVGAAQDLRVEGNHTGTASHTAASADPKYAGLTASLPVLVRDDDTPDLLVAETGTGTRVVEGAATDTIELRLATDHDDAVTVTMAGGADLALEPATVTFLPGELGPKTVQLSAVDDPDREGPHGATLTFTVAGDALYAGLAEPTLPVTIGDNDIPGITVSPLTLALAEAGPTSGSYTVALETRPTDTVQIDVLPSVAGQATVTPSILIIAPAEWSVPRTVTVTALDDPDAEGSHGFTIDHAPRTSDADYRVLAISQVAVSLADDDVPAIVTSAAPRLAEGGAAGNFTVRLATRPLADLLLRVSTDGVTVTPGDLSFPRDAWDTPQEVTVTALDDPSFEGPHAGLVRYVALGSDPRYHGMATEVRPPIADDDLPALLGAPATLAVSEAGGNDTILLRLGSQPRAPVDVALAGSQVAPDVAALRFLPADWDQPQAVTVTALDDGAIEGTPHAGSLLAALTSADPAYGFTATFPVQVADDDTPGVEIVETGRATGVAEDGATDVYSVRLASLPTAEVVIALATDTQATVSPATLRFTPSDWDVPQEVTVAAVNDKVQEPASHFAFLRHTVTAGDAGYLALPERVLPVDVRDDDLAAVRVTQPGGTTDVLEGGATDAYNIVLATQPTAAVTVRVAGDAQAGATPAALTFLPTDWSVPQAVTVTGVQDDAVEGDHAGRLRHTVESADGFYAGLPAADVVARITDDDTAGVFLQETGSATAVAEDGATTDSYTLVLTKAPVVDVEATLAIDAAQATVTPATVRFTPSDWDEPKTVTVQAVDDDRADGDGPFPLTHALSGDAAYAGASIRTLDVPVADDDLPGLVVAEGPLGTIAEEGGPDGRYHLRLTSRPSADVEVRIAGDAQATATPMVVIQPEDWDVLHAVDVTAVQDPLDEDDLHPARLLHSVASADPGYALPDRLVLVQVQDDDAMPTIRFAAAETEQLEDKGSFTVRVELSAVSGRNVTVEAARTGGTALAGTDHGFTGAGITIRAGQRNATLVLPVTADPTPEADESILLALRSPVHATLDDPAAAVHWIATDDLPGVTVTGDPTVHEGGNATTLSVRLPARPEGTVTVRIDFVEHWQVEVGPELLTFTADDWDQPKPVTVGAREDLSPDGDATVVLSFQVVPALSSPEYRRAGSAAVPVAVLDRVHGPGLGGMPVASIVSGGGVDDPPTVIRRPPPPPVRPRPDDVVLGRQPVADHDITDRLGFRADGGPVLEWPAYQGAVGYQVWRDPGDGWHLLATTSGNRLEASDLLRPGDRVKLTFYVGLTPAQGLVRDAEGAAGLRGWDGSEALTVPDYLPAPRDGMASRSGLGAGSDWTLLALALLAFALLMAFLLWRRRRPKAESRPAQVPAAGRAPLQA